MKINILSNKIPWFGRFSGYECLPDYLPKKLELKVYTSKFNLVNKILGKIYKMKNGWNFLRSEDVLAEVQFMHGIRNSSISHILYLETHIHILEKINDKDPRVIGTIHLPISQWKDKQLHLLSKMNNVIILYKEEMEEFAKFIPLHKINYIKHGVDIDFFKPGTADGIQKNKVLFVGHYLRNFAMFLHVYEEIKKQNGKIEVHFIIPSYHRDIAVLNQLSKESNVFFHEKLSDEELLAHYQTSYLLVMPMHDSGANTAIIQALATGLPIVTTDVGGIRSYGGGEIFPVIKNNDHMVMAELCMKYFSDEALRNKTSADQRNFAIQYLDWNKIAGEHLGVFNTVLN